GDRGVLGDPDAVATEEGGDPAVDSGNAPDADVDRLAGGGQQGGRVRHHADLALLERADPGGAGLVPRGRVHRTGGPQLLPGAVDLLGGVTGEQRLGALGVHHGVPGGPDHREPGEHAAATAVATEVGAVDAVLVEGLDRQG